MSFRLKLLVNQINNYWLFRVIVASLFQTPLGTPKKTPMCFNHLTKPDPIGIITLCKNKIHLSLNSIHISCIVIIIAILKH